MRKSCLWSDQNDAIRPFLPKIAHFWREGRSEIKGLTLDFGQIGRPRGRGAANMHSPRPGRVGAASQESVAMAPLNSGGCCAGQPPHA
jgi:hypothetical protein